MSQSLFPYYERELSFIRHAAQEFARQYPAAAGRLLLEPDRSADPHVERLIEAFALLSGRIRHKLDDEFPELTDAMLGVLYPHYLAPVPSATIVQFELDPARSQLPDGFTIPRHARLRTPEIDGLSCRFRTAWPTTLWPVRLLDARFMLPPLPPGLDPPPRAASALRIRLELLGGLSPAAMSIDALRLFLDGDPETVASLYELLLNNVTHLALVDADSGTTVPLDPAQALRPVGLDPDEALLPVGDRSMPGYQLLTEFFSVPSKFHFIELVGLSLAGRAGFGRRFDLVAFLDRGPAKLEQRVEPSSFRLGCVPAVNLFEQLAEPISVTGTRFEHRITPEVAHPDGMEVYSIDSVTGVDRASGSSTEYRPFYAFGHRLSDPPRAFWHASRRPSVRPDDRGTDVFLSLVDLQFVPTSPAESTLVIRTTCTNRDLPLLLQQVGDRLAFTPEFAAPLAALRCLRPPSTPRRPPLGRGAYWRLISHLNLNHLSLVESADGVEALRELLRLYAFDSVDPARGRHEASVDDRLIDGIVSVSGRRVFRQVGDGLAGGFARGLEVTLSFDEEAYIGTGAFLFASVLDRFFGLYTSINAFTQLVARLERGGTTMKVWPPRSGARPIA